jgi:hypothetical protein
LYIYIYSRTVNYYNIADFGMKLSYENWESVFNNSDINTSVNQFLNIFLRHFYASFPLSRRQKYTQNSRITEVLLFPVERKGSYMQKLKKTKILKFGNIIRKTVRY